MGVNSISKVRLESNYVIWRRFAHQERHGYSSTSAKQSGYDDIAFEMFLELQGSIHGILLKNDSR